MGRGPKAATSVTGCAASTAGKAAVDCSLTMISPGTVTSAASAAARAPGPAGARPQAMAAAAATRRK
jgi:hypothetical protein